MKEFIIVCRGHHKPWAEMPDAEWEEFGKTFGPWTEPLRTTGQYGRGARLGAYASVSKVGGEVKVRQGDHKADKEYLTGFFMIKAESLEDAVAFAKNGPPLLHDALDVYQID